MSDNILPVEIQAEIMKRLPVKALLQIRSVCKAWKSLIDSADFIKQYSGQMQYLLLRYADTVDCEENFVSFADDETFPNQKVVFPAIHPLVKMFEYYRIIGSSHGLLFLYGDNQKGRDGPISGTRRAVIWNPSIRKAVDVVVPNVAYRWPFETVVGFGVCRETTDVKIVKITHIYKNWKKDRGRISSIQCQVEVFPLSTGTWRPPYTTSLPRKSICFDENNNNQVVIDGVLYWFARDRIAMDGGFQFYNLIISFDMTSEEFREVNLPDSLAHRSFYDLPMYKLRESLVVLEDGFEANSLCFVVWMMEDGVPKTFTKLFTINLPGVDAYEVYVRGFRKTGEAIIDNLSIYPEWTLSLAVYEPNSKSITSLGVNGSAFSSLMYSYIETLLLL